jgi:hypothetical protein
MTLWFFHQGHGFPEIGFIGTDIAGCHHRCRPLYTRDGVDRDRTAISMITPTIEPTNMPKCFVTIFMLSPMEIGYQGLIKNGK